MWNRGLMYRIALSVDNELVVKFCARLKTYRNGPALDFV